MAGIALKGQSTVNGSTAATSKAATFPTAGSAPAAGDLVLIQVTVGAWNSGTGGYLNTPAGYTKIGEDGSGTALVEGLYYRVFQAGDTAPTFSWAASAKHIITTYVFSNVNQTTPIDVTSASTNNATGTTIATPSITAVTNGAARLAFAGNANGSTWTSDPGTDPIMYEQNDTRTGTSGTQVAHTMGMELGMASGATGTRTLTCSTNNSPKAGWSVFLRPATAEDFGVLQAARVLAKGGNASSAAVAFPRALTSGSALVCCVATYTAGVTGNKITSVVYGAGSAAFSLGKEAFGPTSNNYVSAWYFANNADTTAATVTATRGGGADDISMLIFEVTGIATSSPVDTTASNTANGTSTTASVTTGTISAGSKFAINAVVSDQGGTYVYDTDYDPRFGYSNTVDVSVAFQSRPDITGGGTDTATVTIASGDWASVIVVFNKAASGTQYNKSITLSVSATVARTTQTRAKKTVSVHGTVSRKAQSQLKKVISVTGSLTRHTQAQLKKAVAVSGTVALAKGSVFRKLIQLAVTTGVTVRKQAQLKKVVSVAVARSRKAAVSARRTVAVSVPVTVRKAWPFKVALAVHATVTTRKRAQLRKALAVTGSVSTKRSTARKIALAVSVPARNVKRTAKKHQIAVTGTVSLSYTKVRQFLAQVAVSATVGVKKATSAKRALSISATPTLHKLTRKSSAVSAQVSLHTQKTAGKVAAVPVHIAAALRKRVGKVAGIAVTATASRSQRTGKKLSVPVSATPTVRKRTTRLLAVAASVGVGMQKQTGMIRRVFVLAVAVTPKVTKQVFVKKALLVKVPTGFLNVRKAVTTIPKRIPVSVQAKSFRYIGKRITGIVATVSVSSRKTALKPVRIAVSASTRVTRLISTTKRLAVSVTAAMGRTFFYRAYVAVTVTASWSWRRLNMTVGKFPYVIEFVSNLLKLSKDDRQSSMSKDDRTSSVPAQERALNIPPETGNKQEIP